MSMWVNLARVTPEAFELIQGDPQLLEALFMAQDADVLAKLGVDERDISGLDYEAASEMIEAMGDDPAIEMDEEDEGGDDDEDMDEDADDDEAEDDEDDEGDAESEEDGTMDAGAAEGDDDEQEADVVLVDLCIEGTIPYDAGYGSAFFLSPAAAKQAAESSAALGLDDAAKAIVQAAAERGHFVIGVIS